MRAAASSWGASGVRGRPGFTLVELMVVIAIMAILIALLLPALGKTRDRVEMVRCFSNQRQIGAAIYAYAQHNRDYLPLAREDTHPQASLGVGYWFKRLSEYVSVKKETSNTDRTNTVFACPSHDTPQVYGVYGHRLSYGAMGSLKSGGGLVRRFGEFTNSSKYAPLRIGQLTAASEVGLIGENSNYYQWWPHITTNPSYQDAHHITQWNFLLGDGHCEALPAEAWDDRVAARDKLFFDY